jgi:hypothetical protein
MLPFLIIVLNVPDNLVDSKVKVSPTIGNAPWICETGFSRSKSGST